MEPQYRHPKALRLVYSCNLVRFINSEGKEIACRFTEALEKHRQLEKIDGAGLDFFENFVLEPKPLHYDLSAYQNNQNLPFYVQFKNFLNGDSIQITGNRITLMMSPDICPDAEEARNIVEKIFNPRDPLFQIKPILNGDYYLKIKPDFDSVKIISPMDEEYFKNNRQIKLQMVFTTNVSLDFHIGELNPKKLDEGISITKDNFLPAIKALLENPDAYYLLRSNREFPSLKNDWNATLFSKPHSNEDWKKIFCTELNSRSYTLGSLAFALAGNMLSQSRLSKDELFFKSIFGNQYDYGFYAVCISEPPLSKPLHKQDLMCLISAIESGRLYAATTNNRDSMDNPKTGFNFRVRKLSVVVKANCKPVHDEYSFTPPGFNYRCSLWSFPNTNNITKNRQDALNYLHDYKIAIQYLVDCMNQKNLTTLDFSKDNLNELLFNKISLDPVAFCESSDPILKKYAAIMMSA